jgi:hypothetical protein
LAIVSENVQQWPAGSRQVYLKLRPVGGDSQSNLKAKGFLEPFHGGGNVRIFDDRNDRGRRHGTVHPHHVS